MMTLLAMEEAEEMGGKHSPIYRHPLLRPGFRPFYLLGAAFAAISIPAWVLHHYGLFHRLDRNDLNWHAHKMVYGLAIAIIIGFHAARLGWLATSPLHMVHAAIMIIVIIEAAIGGRVIPMFTARALATSRPVVNARRNRITLAMTAGAGLAWVLALPGPFVAGVAAADAVAELIT